MKRMKLSTLLGERRKGNTHEQRMSKLYYSVFSSNLFKNNSCSLQPSHTQTLSAQNTLNQLATINPYMNTLINKQTPIVLSDN